MELLTPEIGLILWSIVILLLLSIWILTLVNIAKSDFKDPNMRIVWGILVFFLPLLGIILYYAIGRYQRINNH